MAVRDELILEQLASAVGNVPAFDAGAKDTASAIHNFILQDENRRRLADLLHGTWFGHPLHPALITIPFGAWMMGTLFDVLSLLPFTRHVRQAADTLIAAGTAAAIPTAAAGLADYSGIKRNAARHGALHGLLNTAALVLFMASLLARRRGQRSGATLFSLLGMGMAGLSAYIGGEMVYRLNVGTNHTKVSGEPQTWTPVIGEHELMEQQPRRVEVNGEPVLLYRKHGRIYAIGAVCSHAGGPLEEGTFYDFCVQCPWHDSVYDLRDGNPVHGPTTYRQPYYYARIQDGQVEIRAGS